MSARFEPGDEFSVVDAAARRVFPAGSAGGGLGHIAS
jgi:hypothetical protein